MSKMLHKKRVRLVLIHPPLKNVVCAATPDYVDKNRGNTPPLGLLYIQASIERSDHESFFLDAALNGWDHEETACQALMHEPDIVGIQAMSFTMPDAYLVAKAIKALDPDVKTLIGGPHPTIYPGETASLEHVDFALAGEGEASMLAFLHAFHDPDVRMTIPGIACKHGGDVIVNPSKGLIRKLDDVPFPARASSNYRQYSSVLATRNPVTTMITSRGCPFQCVFCNRMGREYRNHSSEYVLAEMAEIVSLGIKEIFIHDDTFSLNRERVVDICTGLIKRKYDIIWEARTRVDCVDRKLLELMRKAGCHRLSFGVESGSERVLRSMRKNTKIKQVEQVFTWCKEEDIITLADFMVGNLDEEPEDVMKSMRLARRLNPDYVQFSICSPYPNTPLYMLAMERGLVEGDVWREFAKAPLRPFSSPVWTQNFTGDQLRRMTKDAYKTFYMRPGFIAKQMLQLRSLAQFKNMLSSAFGMLRG